MDNDYIEETELKGVFIIKRPTFGDDRGFFHEVFRKEDLEKRLGYEFKPVQANHSRSKKAVLRGIHVATWNKLVTAMSGTFQQVVVDLREDSETFGKHISVVMGDENIAVFIPGNCGNGFLTLSDEGNYMYITTAYWEAGKEYNIKWDDPDVGINWEIKEPLISERDQQSPSFKEKFPE